MKARLALMLRPLVLVATVVAMAAGMFALAPAASAAANTDTLGSTEWLAPGQEIRTGNSFSLVMGPDGNLVVYKLGGPDRVPLWASGTGGHPGAYLVMQDDGNVVIYYPTGGGNRVALWGSATDRHPGAYLTIQGDGNVVVYYPTGGGNRVPLWATNTQQTNPPPPSGDRQALAQSILNNPRILKGSHASRPAVVVEDLQQAAAGRPSNGGAYLSTTMLRVLVQLAQTHTFSISSLTGNGTGHSSGSLHYAGLGVDINSVDGRWPITGRDPGSVAAINAIKGMLPRGARIGQSGCGTTPPLPSGVMTIPDTCNHLHIDLPRGTA